MKTISRGNFLQQLQSIAPGLSPRDIIEQSSCFAFRNGEMMTYNDEVACRMKTSLKLKGAVQGKPLISMLEKMNEEDIQVGVVDGELLVVGKKRKAGIRMEKEVLLPIDNVEEPKKFKPLHDDFLEGMNMVKECTGKDEQKFWTNCVHIHPKWVEACDNFQITRFRVKTQVNQPTLIRSSAVKFIVDLEMSEFSETDDWMHFRNGAGLILSCRRYLDQFPDFRKLLASSGTPTTLPKGLAEATERANVFSEENTDNNYVTVELRPGKIKVRGEGVSGWYSEIKKLKYRGPALDFEIRPALLAKITRQYNDCEISEGRLKVDGGKFTYVTILSKVGESANDEESGGSDGDSDSNEEG
jgi:hypothetical protein